MVLTRTHAKDQGQRSVGSINQSINQSIKVICNARNLVSEARAVARGRVLIKREWKQMDRGDCIISSANVVGNYGVQLFIPLFYND